MSGFTTLVFGVGGAFLGGQAASEANRPAMAIHSPRHGVASGRCITMRLVVVLNQAASLIRRCLMVLTCALAKLAAVASSRISW